jgi:hypothetical protein
VIEIALLAGTVVSKFLVPLFKKGKKGFADGLAEEEGHAAAVAVVETAGKIWDSVEKQFGHGDAKSALDLFQRSPEAMDKMLIELLTERFKNDHDFYRDIDELVEAPVTGSNTTSWAIMADYVGIVDARNAKISGGTTAGMIIGGARENDSSKIGPAGEVGRA